MTTQIPNEETIEQLKFIKNAKDLGFTLSEIKELLDLSSKAWTTAGDIKKQAEKKHALLVVNAKVHCARQMGKEEEKEEQ